MKFKAEGEMLFEVELSGKGMRIDEMRLLLKDMIDYSVSAASTKKTFSTK